jgi:RsmE family RNA methyltransferase
VNLLLFDPAGVAQDGVVRVAGAQAAHLLAVLNVEPGQTVRVGLIDGPCGVGTVVAASGDAVDLRCVFEPIAPPRPPVDLLLALPRPKVMRRLWAQLAALGVGRIILTNAGRVERDYFDAHVLMEPYYRPLLIEGLQQARDTRLPAVTIHRRFKVLVEDDLDGLCPGGQRLVAHPGGAAVTDVVTAASDERVLLAIGPEGGWNAFELRLLESRGFQRVGMGARTLRTDTACIALLALVHARLLQIRMGTL